jgi:hypothetical protein
MKGLGAVTVAGLIGEKSGHWTQHPREYPEEGNPCSLQRTYFSRDLFAQPPECAAHCRDGFSKVVRLYALGDC